MLGLSGIVSSLATPVRALSVSLAGVLLAWLWFGDRVRLALVLAAALLVVAWLVTAAGDLVLPRAPRVGVRLLEMWILLPALAAAIGSAATIILAVKLTLPESTPTDTKKIVTALSTGITSFITSVVVSWASDENDSRLADFIKSRFYTHFKRKSDVSTGNPVYFEAGSDGERWVYSEEFKGVVGWGRPSRLKRAKGVAEALPKR